MRKSGRVGGTALALLLVGLSGCGYHLAGNGGALPASTRVIAVLPFANHTRQPQLSQSISAAVAQEFLRRTHYRVSASAAGSDAVLHGDVLSVVATPVTFDATSGRATTVDVVIHCKAWLTTAPDAEGRARELFRNDDMIFHDQYEISPQEQNFFEEDSSSFARLSQAVAQTLVADILEAF